MKYLTGVGALLAIIVILLIMIFHKEQKLRPTRTLVLASPVIDRAGLIPAKYTCDGENISPPLSIRGVDDLAASLVLIVDDPDAPNGTFDHWVKFNIPTFVKEISEGLEPEGISGKGSAGNLSYTGPCPPDREHRYFFRIYSLDQELRLPQGSTKNEILSAMDGHIIQQAELMARYVRR